MAEGTNPNAEPQPNEKDTEAASPTESSAEAKTNEEPDNSAKSTEAKTEDDSADKEAKAKAAKAKAAKAKADGTAKKAKKPAPEDKPFEEFIEQEFIPALQEAFPRQGIEDMELSFVNEKLAIAGASSDEPCWQVVGNWQNGQRQFNLYFLDGDIKGQKAFAYATSGAQPSTVESFMIDERRVTLDLMVLYTLQRLNGQKWLVRN